MARPSASEIGRTGIALIGLTLLIGAGFVAITCTGPEHREQQGEVIRGMSLSGVVILAVAGAWHLVVSQRVRAE